MTQVVNFRTRANQMIAEANKSVVFKRYITPGMQASSRIVGLLRMLPTVVEAFTLTRAADCVPAFL